MDKNSLLNKLKEFRLNTKEEYMAEAFSRNIGLLTHAEQDKFAKTKVAILCTGGLIVNIISILTAYISLMLLHF